VLRRTKKYWWSFILGNSNFRKNFNTPWFTKPKLTKDRVDSTTEFAARWLAARSTRRSFLAGVARVAMIGVGTKAVSAVLSDQAQARVCGQSGTSPMCPTYDCVGPDVVFGYCWYASPGCCANGGLKKICDCCGIGYKNVQGYCPQGSAVYCVVESCLEDPRVQSVPLERYVVADPIEASIAALIDRGADTTATVVLVSAEDPLLVAVAMPVASELGAPLVACDRNSLSAILVDELKRVGVRRVVTVGPISASMLSALEALGATTIDRITTAADQANISLETAKWLAQRTGFYEAVCIGAGGAAVTLAPVAGAYAAQRRRPLLISADAVGAFLGDRTAGVAFIGTEVAGANSRFAGSISMNSDDPQLISLTMANRGLSASQGTVAITFADASQSFVASPLALGAIVVLVPSASNDVLRDWLMENRKRFSGAKLVRAVSAPADDSLVYALQSALNGYDAHLLSGNDGDGLPVYAQPFEEQAMGAVRVTGPLPSTTVMKSAPIKPRKTGTTAPVGVQAPATAPARRAGPQASTSTLFVPKSSHPTIAVRGNRQVASTSSSSVPNVTTTTGIDAPVPSETSGASSIRTTTIARVRPLGRSDP
jgi:hypothetical protein